MLLLAAGHIWNSYNVYNCGYIIQVFLVLKIIEKHVNTYYSSTY